MKKGSKLILSVVLIFALSACGNDGGRAEGSSLYQKGLEVVRLMSEMTRSDEYMDLYTENPDVRAVVQHIAGGDHTSPKAVYAIHINEDSLGTLTQMADLDQLSDALKTFLSQRSLSSLTAQINSRGGAAVLAASSICTVEKTFADPTAEENVIYLYTYENAVPAAVTFLTGEDQTIAAKGFFVLYDGFSCGSADEIKASFPGLLAVEVNEITEK